MNGPVAQTFRVGDTGSLYLYYSTNGPADSDLEVGAILDIGMSRSGVIRFTDAEVFDFTVAVGQLDCHRWSGGGLICQPNTGATDFGAISEELLNEWGAFTVTSFGILEENNGSGAFFDGGYDLAADAFLFGRVDFEVMTNTRGSTEILTGPGNGMVVNRSQSCDPPILNLTYGSARIDVVDSYILGDVNLDGSIDLLDVSTFVERLDEGDFQLEADTNFDQVVNLLDVPGFVELLVGDAPPDNPPLGDPEDGLVGDVNCDGYVNMIDGQCLIEILLEKIPPCNFSNADLNQDGKINVLDLNLIPQTIVKNIQ